MRNNRAGLINFAGGLAGATALNMLHETVKRLDHQAPRVDLVGEEALSKIIRKLGGEPPKGDALYAVTLAADIVSNALYFSLVGFGKDKGLLLRGVGYGLGAGVGALTLTKPMGLRDAPVTRTEKTKVLTVAWYVFGGIVAAMTIKAIRN